MADPIPDLLPADRMNEASTAAESVWTSAVVTNGGGVAATIAELRRHRGKNKLPTKQQVAIRLDADVLQAFRASGPGWQPRMNAALRTWLLEHGDELSAEQT